MLNQSTYYLCSSDVIDPAYGILLSALELSPTDINSVLI